jgi:hypothetical protein
MAALRTAWTTYRSVYSCEGTEIAQFVKQIIMLYLFHWVFLIQRFFNTSVHSMLNCSFCIMVQANKHDFSTFISVLMSQSVIVMLCRNGVIIYTKEIGFSNVQEVRMALN